MSNESKYLDIQQTIAMAIEKTDDLTFSLLRQAARDSQGRPSADKTLVQARRALEKAHRLIETLERTEEDD